MTGEQSLGEKLQPFTHPSPVEAEIAAMSAIVAAFEPLDDESRKRVLDWAAAKFPCRIDRDVIEFLDGFLKTIGEHQKASMKQPRNADKTLWDATIKGSIYWNKEAPKPEVNGAHPDANRSVSA